MPPLTERVGQASLHAGAAGLRGLERLVLRSSLVPTSPFIDPALLPWTAELEAHWREVREELDAVLVHHDALPNFQDISTDQATITDDDRWKTFFLFGFGFRSDANCARCPRTAELLERVPGMTTAFFSILSPGKHIGAHRGPYRGLLRYHLGLRIPAPVDACGISVGGEVAHWEEGGSLLFDDGYEHFAWNDTDGVRAVLFMDVERPLRQPAALVNHAIISAVARSPFVEDAKRREAAWEHRFAELTRRLGPRPGATHDPRLDARLDPRVDPRLDPRLDPGLGPRDDPRLDPAGDAL